MLLVLQVVFAGDEIQKLPNGPSNAAYAAGSEGGDASGRGLGVGVGIRVGARVGLGDDETVGFAVGIGEVFSFWLA